MITADTLSPIERIDQAFLQLEFAIKLMNYFDLRKIDKNDFDQSTIVLLEGGSLNFPDASFKTYDDLVIAAENVYTTCVGLCAITLETAFQDANIPNAPDPKTDRDHLRNLVYMVRNAFAHDPMTPAWVIQDRYKRILTLAQFDPPLIVDLTNLDGHPLDIEQLGGPLVFYKIKDEVRQWLHE